jgi:protein CpxP
VKSKIAKFAAFGALAVALVAGVALAEANGGPGMRHGMHHGMMGGDMGLGMFLHHLNLTEEQHAQVKQIMQNEHPTFKPLMQQEGQLHQQMLQLVTSGNFDQAKASAIASQEAQVHMQMQLEHMKIASQIYALLDSNQKAQVGDMIAKHQQHMQEHMQQMENQNAPAPQDQQ